MEAHNRLKEIRNDARERQDTFAANLGLKQGSYSALAAER